MCYQIICARLYVTDATIGRSGTLDLYGLINRRILDKWMLMGGVDN